MKNIPTVTGRNRRCWPQSQNIYQSLWVSFLLFLKEPLPELKIKFFWNCSLVLHSYYSQKGKCLSLFLSLTPLMIKLVRPASLSKLQSETKIIQYYLINWMLCNSCYAKNAVHILCLFVSFHFTYGQLTHKETFWLEMKIQQRSRVSVVSLNRGGNFCEEHCNDSRKTVLVGSCWFTGKYFKNSYIF
jgi:hypothetical protein